MQINTEAQKLLALCPKHNKLNLAQWNNAHTHMSKSRPRLAWHCHGDKCPTALYSSVSALWTPWTQGDLCLEINFHALVIALCGRTGIWASAMPRSQLAYHAALSDRLGRCGSWLILTSKGFEGSCLPCLHKHYTARATPCWYTAQGGLCARRGSAPAQELLPVSIAILVRKSPHPVSWPFCARLRF